MISTRLENKQIKTLKIIGKKIGVALFWVLLWAMAAWWVDSSLVLPSPIDTMKGIATLAGDAEFFVSIGVTLLRVFGGEELYVPRCEEALRELRNEQFRHEFLVLTEREGVSKLMAMSALCPKYKISERTGYTIRRGRLEPVSHQQTLF